MKKIEKVPFPPPRWVTENLYEKVLQFVCKDAPKHESEFNKVVLPILKRYNISVVKRVYPD